MSDDKQVESDKRGPVDVHQQPSLVSRVLASALILLVVGVPLVKLGAQVSTSLFPGNWGPQYIVSVLFGYAICWLVIGGLRNRFALRLDRWRSRLMRR